MLFVFCESEWVTHMFVSSTLRGVLLSLFAVSLLFGLRLALFIAPVSGACFPAQGFLFLVFLWPLQLSATSPLFLWLLSGSLVCLSFPLELSIPLVACLTSSIRLSSSVVLSSPLSCSRLFFLLLPLAPVCCLLHFAPLSLLRWLCPALFPGFQFSLVLFLLSLSFRVLFLVCLFA